MRIRKTALTLLGIALSAGAPTGSRSAPEAATSTCNPRLEAYTHLEIDYLEDEIEPPEAYSVNSGSLPASGEARFRVFAVTDDPRYFCDITAAFLPAGMQLRRREGGHRIAHVHRPSLGILRIRSHGLGKERGALRETYYDPIQNVLVYRPKPHTDRTGSLDFKWSWRSPTATFATRFVLTVPPE